LGVCSPTLGLRVGHALPLVVFMGDHGVAPVAQACFPPNRGYRRAGMRDKQLRIEHAAVQVDARAWGDAAAGALLRVRGGGHPLSGTKGTWVAPFACLFDAGSASSSPVGEGEGIAKPRIRDGYWGHRPKALRPG